MSRFWESLWAALLREPPPIGKPIRWSIRVPSGELTVVLIKMRPDLIRVESEHMALKTKRQLLNEFMDVALPGRWQIFSYHLNPFTFEWECIYPH